MSSYVSSHLWIFKTATACTFDSSHHQEKLFNKIAPPKACLKNLNWLDLEMQTNKGEHKALQVLQVTNWHQHQLPEFPAQLIGDLIKSGCYDHIYVCVCVYLNSTL